MHFIAASCFLTPVAAGGKPEPAESLLVSRELIALSNANLRESLFNQLDTENADFFVICFFERSTTNTGSLRSLVVLRLVHTAWGGTR